MNVENVKIEIDDVIGKWFFMHLFTKDKEVYIWILNKKEDEFNIEIWLGLGKLSLIMFYEGEEVLKDKDKILFSATTSYYYFVQNVKEAFHTYFDFKEEKNHEYEIDFRLLDSLRGY